MSHARLFLLPQRRTLCVSLLTVVIAGKPALLPVANSTEIVSLTLLPQEVVTGGQASGSVRLDAAALAAVRVDLASDDPAIARVPASVLVPAGARSVAFPIQTFSDAAGCTRISARIGSTSARFDELFVLPRPAPAKAPITLRVESTTVVASGSVLATVQLLHAAPAGGTTIQLASSNRAAATVPASIVIAPGALQQRFVVNTAVIASSTCAVISAAVGANSSKALIKIVGVAR